MLWSTVEQTRADRKLKTPIDAERVASRASSPLPPACRRPTVIEPPATRRVYPRGAPAAAWITGCAGLAEWTGPPGCAIAPAAPATATDAPIDPAAMRTTTALVITSRPRRVSRTGPCPRAAALALRA